MLMGSDKSPKNLNLITPFECADVLYAYIVSDLQYAHVDTDATPHCAFGDSLNSLVIFEKGNLNITVSEATPDGIFNVVTSSPTTTDMTIMTPGGLAVYYPHWTMRKIALESHWMRRANFDSEEQMFVGPSIGCAGKSIFSMERTMNFLEEHYDGFMRGLVYGTSASTPHVVSVPFRDGIDKLGDISHLQVTHWVNQLGPDLFVSLTGRLHKTYNLIVEMPVGAPALGYTFFCKHPGVFAAPNRLIWMIAGITENVDDVTGNVLVVKHAHRRNNDIMDCDKVDMEWVNHIMKQ
ncbi:hypothetical protein BD769DRAFT_1666482 [Suillus cothurnatus]|nr:hypothetical protein BD769DRAFT_1666482 [Suillus cothurnatus]